MSYTALEIAKYTINKCSIDRHPISNLQLQKILYYIQRTFLRNNTVAFDDDFEAWKFGPVVPAVYNRYCSFGGTPIRLYYSISINDNFRNIIDAIIVSKRDLNPWAMVDDTHKPGMAWDEIYRDGYGSHQQIPKSLIKMKG